MTSVRTLKKAIDMNKMDSAMTADLEEGIKTETTVC